MCDEGLCLCAVAVCGELCITIFYPAVFFFLSSSSSAGMSFTRLIRTDSRRWLPSTLLDVWSSPGTCN